jgi:hypothetical protein
MRPAALRFISIEVVVTMIALCSRVRAAKTHQGICAPQRRKAELPTKIYGPFGIAI